MKKSSRALRIAVVTASAVISTLVLVPLLILGIAFFKLAFPSNSMEELFDSWEMQSDSDIIFIDSRENTVVLDGKTESINSLVDEHFTSGCPEYLLIEIDGRIYGVNESVGDDIYYSTLEIVVIDVNAQNAEVLYSGKYSPRATTDLNGSDYPEKVFYSDGKIVIADGTVVTVYDLETSTVENIPIADAPIFNESLTVSRMYNEDGSLDFKSITVSGKDSERIIDIDYMAQRHPYVDELSKLDHHKTVFEKIDPLKVFFHDYFVINDKVYFVCNILDRDGDSNAAVFSYDYKNDSFEYVYHSFTFDTPNLIVCPRKR